MFNILCRWGTDATPECRCPKEHGNDNSETTKVRTDGNGTGRPRAVTFATNRSTGRAGRGGVELPPLNFVVSQSRYLHSALGTRPVRHDRPSRAQLSGRFGDADGDDVPSAVIQGLLTTRSRRVGHMHAPPPITLGNARKKFSRREEREKDYDGRTRARAPARSARPSPAVTRVTRHASYSRANPPRCALEPTLDQYATVLVVR
jgi:hypothetical protein